MVFWYYVICISFVQFSLSGLFFAPSLLASGSYDELQFFIFPFVMSFIFVILARPAKKEADRLRDENKVEIPLKCIRSVAIISFIIVNIYYFSVVIMYGGHQAIYTSNVFSYWLLPFKILALPAFYLALITVGTERKALSEKLGWLAILSTLLSGSRGLFLFSLVSTIFYKKGVYFALSLKAVALCSFLILMFLVIGFIREPIGLNFISYVSLVVGSLSQFSSAAINASTCDMNQFLVFSQYSKVFFGILDSGRVTYNLTECFLPGAVLEGYGISSSLVAESVVLGGDNWYVIYCGVVVLNSIVAGSLLSTKNNYLRAVGIAFLPFVFYSFRAEIVYPYVFLVKITVFLAVTYLFSCIIRWSVLMNKIS